MVCCELWPGNQADSRALLPVVDRLRRRAAWSTTIPEITAHSAPMCEEAPWIACVR
jgi:hypothetical protein